MAALSDASEYIKAGKVNTVAISPDRIITEVGKYTVIYQKKLGRIEQTCSCTNHSKHPGSMCSHKFASAAYNVMRGVKL